MSIAQQVTCAAEVIMWNEEVLDKTACQTFTSGDLLQPKQPFLAALRYLHLLHKGSAEDARPIIAMKQARYKGERDLGRCMRLTCFRFSRWGSCPARH